MIMILFFEVVDLSIATRLEALIQYRVMPVECCFIHSLQI